jgi:dihydropyrimidine dehydrogenase (NAD+) subunit PreA
MHPVDLSCELAGIRAPNPFWLASAPPTNTASQVLRAYDWGWGGAVWKTLGKPVRNVQPRFTAMHTAAERMVGFSNIELITDRPLEDNYREIAAVTARFPDRATIVSLMFETEDEWKENIERSIAVGAKGVELNFGCPHGMCERGMGSAVGQEPALVETITRWAVRYAGVPVLVKLTPNVTDIIPPALAAQRGGAHGVSLINTVKSIMGVDLDRMVPLPVVGDASTNGGYCGPAVKPIALHMVGALARHPDFRLPISGMGGIGTWRDAAEFLALGARSVQICTAVMHHGYRIIQDLTDGLGHWMEEKGYRTMDDLIGRAVPNFRPWEELDLNHRVVARIQTDKCIGCQLCYVACLDGSHQCIYLPGADHPDAPIRLATESRIPWVAENECTGCQLCHLVCPVEGAIEMMPLHTGQPRQNWRELQALAVTEPGTNNDSTLEGRQGFWQTQGIG